MNPTEQLPRRKPEYLSPSALQTFEKNSQEYYIRYIAPVKALKLLQTQPMSVGSSFDAYCKSFLHEKLLGKNHPEADKYGFEALFVKQVEEHNRLWAREAGKHVFEEYQRTGALADLMLELATSVDDPRFEFELSAKIQGVPLLGRPDLRYISSEGAHVIHDWKVNGYCGWGNTSPKPGYIRCRGDGSKGAHKDAFIQKYKGLDINTGTFIENVDQDWALQTCTYGWILGTPVGEEIIVSIDQVACHGGKKDAAGRPSLRFAAHRARAARDFQLLAIERYKYLWGILTAEPFYFFRELSFEDSAAKCQMLDDQCALMASGNLTDDEAWVMSLSRKQ